MSAGWRIGSSIMIAFDAQLGFRKKRTILQDAHYPFRIHVGTSRPIAEPTALSPEEIAAATTAFVMPTP